MCENIRTSGKLVIFKINKFARNEHANFHPSGVSEPSEGDIVITEKLEKAAELMGIHF